MNVCVKRLSIAVLLNILFNVSKPQTLNPQLCISLYVEGGLRSFAITPTTALSSCLSATRFELSSAHVTRHTSHVTRRTSHVTHHTSHVTRHTSHVTRHTSHVTRHTLHVTRHTLHVTRHTSRRAISDTSALFKLTK